MAKTRLVFLTSAALLLPSAAHAICSGAGGWPFNCTAASAPPSSADLFMCGITATGVSSKCTGAQVAAGLSPLLSIPHTAISDWATATAGFGAGSTGVSSVAGRTGAVTLTHGDLTDWGTATAAFLTSAPVSSVAGRAGAVTLSAGDISGLAAAAAAAAPVQSVAGRTGTVTLAHGDISDWTSATAGFGAGGSVTWPASADLVLSNGSSSPGGLAPVNGDCVVASGGAWTAGSCAGGVPTATTTSLGMVKPDGATIVITSGGTISSSYPVASVVNTSFAVGPSIMGNTQPVAITGGGTITIPASGFGSTFFISGQASCFINTGTSADTLANASGATMVPAITTLYPKDEICLQSDGASLYATYTPAAAFSANVVIPNASVAAAPLPTPGTAATLVGPRSYYICTGTCTVTLPTPAAGDEFCVQNDDNVTTVITLAALGGSAAYENSGRTGYGTPGSGTYTSGGAAGDKICLLGRDSTHYLTQTTTGTWTAH